MNALKVFVIVIGMFFSAAASAVTVSIVPNKEVGLGHWGYWEGVVTVSIDSKEYWAMMIDPLNFQNNYDSWQTDTTPQELTIYTREDILAGAQVAYPSGKYSEMSGFFLDAMLGVNPPDPCWTASFGEMIMDRANGGVQIFGYANDCDTGNGTTFRDAYNARVAQGLSDTSDYSSFMLVASNVQNSYKEFLIFAPAVPIPPAIWLFGSGLLGLAGIARRKVFRT